MCTNQCGFNLCNCNCRNTCCKSKSNECKLHTVSIVGDRFIPFQLTINVGDCVQWINTEEDDVHTVVANPANIIGPKPFDKVVPVDNGIIKHRFCEAGLWTYYCKYHATLNYYKQPIAPGPGSDNAAQPEGVQGFGDVTVSPMNDATIVPCPEGCADGDSALCCNYGTPMMGVICVLPRNC